MNDAFGSVGAVASVSPATKAAAVVVARGQAVVALKLAAWADSASNNGLYDVGNALTESAAMVRGDHFVNFVNGSSVLTTNNLSNMRYVRELHLPVATRYDNAATAATAQPDTESAAVFTVLGSDHVIMQGYVDRMYGGCATKRWPRPIPITQSYISPGAPIATGQALVDAEAMADVEAYFVAICQVVAQYGRMTRAEGLALGMLAVAETVGGDYWRRLATLTGLVGMDDAANLTAAQSLVAELQTAYEALAAAATAAGDGFYASMVSTKLVDVQAIGRRLGALHIS